MGPILLMCMLSSGAMTDAAAECSIDRRVAVEWRESQASRLSRADLPRICYAPGFVPRMSPVELPLTLMTASLD